MLSVSYMYLLPFNQMKSLGKQNRLLFNEMLRDYQENKEYIKAIDTKGKSYSAESCIWL
jgi:hypothetical protein